MNIKNLNNYTDVKSGIKFKVKNSNDIFTHFNPDFITTSECIVVNLTQNIYYDFIEFLNNEYYHYEFYNHDIEDIQLCDYYGVEIIE